MKYKDEWKGHLKIEGGRHMFWDGNYMGTITSRWKDGAKSPKGMITNTVYIANQTEFQSMAEAIEALIPPQKQKD